MAVAHDAAAPAVDYVSACAGVAAEVLTAIGSCDLRAPVPACPGWTTYDLVVHLGNTHAWAATIVETGRSAAEQNDQPPARRAKAVARWYAGKAEDLLQVLATADPDDPCWTFSAGHDTKGFWARRQTHEALVHLVDLLQASRGTTAVPSWLAADGVSEVLEVFLPRMHARGRPARIDAPLLLRATDTGHAWRVAPAPATSGGSPVVESLIAEGFDEPGGSGAGGPAVLGDAAGSGGRRLDVVSAPAADLMLLLWKRVPASAPTVTLDGDRRRILAFLRSPLTP